MKNNNIDKKLGIRARFGKHKFGNRSGFGMMFALIITVLVATLGILALRLSSSTLNTTTNQHIGIQLDLYMNSTIELAILYIQRNGFVYAEGSDTTKRQKATDPIEKYIEYGLNGAYKFNYKMTPLGDYSVSVDEAMKNAMILDVSGYVVNPITNQTFRATRRLVVKP